MALKSFQYNSIIRGYEERRDFNRLIHDRRMEEIYKKIPEYKALEDDIIDSSMKYAPNSAESLWDLAALRRHIIENASKKRILLVQNGYPEDYLEPIYTCPDCKDTGYTEIGKCHCFKQAEVDILYSQSNIQKKLKDENFGTFNFKYYSKTLKDELDGISSYDYMVDAYNTAMNFTKDFDTIFKNLCFYGNAGVGKTFLSNCIANELLKSSHTVLYLTAPQLFDRLGEAMRRKEYDEENDTKDFIYNCDLLIIDDLGSEMVSEFTNSQLNIVINERLLAQRSTIISTNLTPGEIRATYGERNFSRISGFYDMIFFFGKDIRLQKRFS